MKKQTKPYEIIFELQTVSITRVATGKREAKKKALKWLASQNPVSLIDREFRTHRKKINVEEI